MGIWEYYGLAKNPFEITPVEIEGLIPIGTFIGREKELSTLLRVIESSDRSVTLLVGEQGVGKTSLANYVKHLLKDSYFSPISEIDCQPGWSADDLIEDILYSIFDSVSKFEKKNGSKLAQLEDALKEYFKIDEKTRGLHIGGQVAGFGLNFGAESGGNKSVQRASHLYFKKTLESVCNASLQSGFKGIILHANNLENVALEDEDGLKRMLSGLRDTLEINHCHFIFVGNESAADCFNSDPKVRNVISDSLPILAFGTDKIKQIIRKRLELFKMPSLILIPPCDDDCIDFLCQLHEGNIRDVLNALFHAITSLERGTKKDIVLTRALAKKTLKQLAEQQIASLTDREKQVLEQILREKETTNTKISEALNLQQSNTSAYLGKLRKSQFVSVVRSEGTQKYYRPLNKAKWMSLKLEPETRNLSDF